MDRNPGSAVSQLPGRNPVLPEESEAEASSSPVAAPEPKSRFPPGWSWIRRSGVLPEISHLPEGRPEILGRFTKPAAFASAKGQARSFRLAAASSAALPPLPSTLPPEDDRPDFGSGCGWEGFPPLPGDRLGHVRKLS